jgi:hypothetical protein
LYDGVLVTIKEVGKSGKLLRVLNQSSKIVKQLTSIISPLDSLHNDLGLIGK